MMRAVAAILLAAAVAGAPTAAQPQAGQDAAERVLGGLRACRALKADAERLACFDRAAAALDTAVAAKEVTVLDKQEVRRTRRGLFGFTLPKIALFGGGDGNDDEAGVEDVTELNSKVASARGVENGRVEFTLADEGDAVWRTTDPMTFPPRSGTAVRIRKGALGNYFIRFEGSRGVRGMRIR